MGEKEKTKKKVSRQIIWLVLLLFLIASAAVATCVKVFQDGIGQSQVDEDKVRAYLAATDSKDYGVTEEEADEWLRAFLEAEGEDSVEINRTLLPTKGYDVNGTKTMTGSGEFVYTNANGGTAFRVNEGSSFTVEGISVKGEKNIGLGVNVKKKATLVWKDGSILEATEYGILSDGDVVLENVAIEESSNWLLLNKGASGKLTNVNFYMSGSAGIVVEAGASCEIGGNDTILERTGSCAVKNNGELVMTGGTTFMTTGYGIDNFGTAKISNVTMNRSITGGGIQNVKGAVVEAKDCTFINNKYHVWNSGEMTLKSCEMNVSGGSAVYSDVGGVLNITDVSIRDTGYNGLYVLNSTVNAKDLKCELINSSAITVMGKDSVVNVDGLEVDNCNVAIRNGEDADKTYGAIYASNVTVKNADSYNVVSYGGTCDISDSTLHPSKGYSVYIRDGASVLDSVKILGTSVEGKGGIAVGSSEFKDAKVTIQGNTEITGCMGSGIVNDALLTINNVDIHDNNVSGKNERGTGIVSYGTIYLHGGKIHDNYATKYGAGIWLGERTKTGQAGKLYMYGGEVRDNTAGVNGGGITVGADVCLLEMHGGSVTDNRAYGKGDGILLNGKFALYDADSFEDNDVYLYTDKTTVQVLSDKLSFEQMKIVPEGYTYDRVLVEFKDAKAAAELCENFTTRNHQFAVGANDKNGILVNSIQDFDTTYDFSKAAKVTVTTFAQLKEEIESTKIGTSKVISIAADIVLTEKITLPVYTDIKLIDDGTSRTLTRGVAGNLFVVTKASHLVMSGISQLALDGGAVNGVVAEYGLVTVKNFGYFVLEANAVVQNAYNTGTKSDGGVRGAAVNLDREGYFILDGGTIKNCSSPADETYNTNYCAVYLATSSGMSMKNGTIAECNDRAVFSYGKVYMSGGSIDNCSHMKSGGAAFRGTTLVMTGGTMENCVSTNSGSAVFMITSSMMPEGYFLLDGGKICNNTVGTAMSTNKVGGAVYVAENCVFDFESGSVSDNVAGDEYIKMSGAGINNAGTTNIGAGAVISGNVATLSHGGIYNTGTMTITGATITENTSTSTTYNGTSYGAGAAIYNKGALSMDSAKVVNNNLGTNGTIYNDGGNLALKDMTFTGNVSSQNGYGVDLRVATGTKSATLSGTIIAEEEDSAFRLDLDKYFVLAEDFSSDSKINLRLAGTHYDGRRVLAGNLSEENVGCFTWTNAPEGWHLSPVDGCIYMTRPEAKIGETIYATLEAAIAAAKDGDTIQLIDNVELSKQIVIDKEITITTDGVEDRVITSTYKKDFPIIVEAKDKTVVFKGSSADAKLIFEGTGENPHTHSILRLKEAKQVIMEYVDINNANRNGSGGGGAINKAVPLILTNCNFTNCQVTNNNGGAITGSGALTATNCTFTNCQATKSGGAIYCSGVVELKDCTFEGNSAGENGEAIYLAASLPVLILDEGEKPDMTIIAVRGNKSVQLHHENSYVFYASLDEAATAAVDGDEIILTADIELDKQVKIENAVTITTDGVTDRVITSTYTSGPVIKIEAGTVKFLGTDANSQLIIDGQKLERPGSLVHAEEGTTVELQYVTMTGGNSTLTTNHSGGAFVSYGSFDIKNSKFSNNQTKGYGGAIWVSGTSPFEIADCEFTNNQAGKRGGAIYSTGAKSDGDIQLTDCTFEKNCSATDGGAIYVANKNTLNVKDSSFNNNTATAGFGGAVAMGTVASEIEFEGEVTFASNTAGDSSHGGGAVFSGSSLTIKTGADVSFEQNKAETTLGGAIYFNTDMQNKPEFTLEESATLVMTGNKDKNGTTDIAVEQGMAVDINLNGSYKISRIHAEVGTLITLGANSSDSDSNNLTMVYLTGTVPVDGSMQLVDGSEVADTIFAVSADQSVDLSADGYLVGVGKTAKLVRSDGSTDYYDGLADAMKESEDGDTIILMKDIGLNEQVKIENAITITTDEVGRTISISEELGNSAYPIHVSASGKDVTFKGSSADATLTINGTGDTGIGKMLIYLNAANSVTMEHVNIQNANRSSGGGGGAINSSVPLTLTNCNFTNCQVTGNNGGAITCSGKLTVTNCTFTDCMTVSKSDAGRNKLNGGAINVSGEATLTNCQFSNCKTTVVSGATDADYILNGGAISASSKITLTSCTFTGCEAYKGGGAVYSQGQVTLTSCTFTGNKALGEHGGAVRSTKGVGLTSCTFSSNESANGGGAIHVSGENSMTINGCTFESNVADDYGGAVSMGTDDATLNLEGECLFKGNTSTGGSTHSAGAILAPSKLNIKSGAVVKMTENNCTKHQYGDAISINILSDTKAEENNGVYYAFTIESGAVLYVWNNPDVDVDADDTNVNDVCLEKGAEATVNGTGTYSTSAPPEQTSMQNLYTSMVSMALRVRSKQASL